MGVCSTREKKVELEGVPEIENHVYKHECKIGLHTVQFDTFHWAIQSHGYVNDLNNEHMKAIADDIHLDYIAMANDDLSPYAIVYLDEKFRTPEKRHCPKNLARLGWICCMHTN